MKTDLRNRYEVLTKLDAAERQLAVAIRLFFERRDMVAVHTLATAAQQVLTDLAAHRGIKSIFEDERLTDLRPVFRQSQNFLKHADKDPEEKLAFFPEATKLHLFDAALLAGRLTALRSPEAVAFLGWFFAQEPNLFDATDSPWLISVVELAKKQKFDDFDAVLRAIERSTKTS